jgi:NADH:quinone reductase (non-electrogenic)
MTTRATRRILIDGGGYAGFYTAWKLEKRLRAGEAEVILVDPLPYMTYQPFLPEVAAGSIDPRHAVIPFRRHLKRTRILAGRVTSIDHAAKTVTVRSNIGEVQDVEYDVIAVTAGAVSRTFPIPGVADQAIGLKNIEEAMEIRDRVLTNFDSASQLPPGPHRDRLLTFVVVGGGYAGVEVFAELRSLATALLKVYPELRLADTHFHLIEVAGRIMPEVSMRTSQWVIRNLAGRGAQVHLDTSLVSAAGGIVELSTGERFESDTIIWAAGVMANPTVRHSDLPLEERGRLRVTADLRVSGDQGIVADAWGAGDVAAVPDLSGGGVGGYTAPNAQNAVRQGKLLARNLVADLRGRPPKQYRHHNLGAVAGLGLGVGVFQSGRIGITGLPAWLMHRGYHGLAVPSWERKVRVLVNWTLNVVLGRDLASLQARVHARAAFEEFAAK